MEVKVNSQRLVAGTPGSYVTLDRTWKDGDEISFVLPIALKLTRYTGVDQVPGSERYALEFGPILLAAVGSTDAVIKLKGKHADDLIAHLVPESDQELRYAVKDNDDVKYIPYWRVQDEPFTCFPVVDTQPA
jgi:DUF1680 family protein